MLKKEAHMAITSNIGFLLLAIYLILMGINSIVPIPLPAIVYGILALISGIFILLGR